MCKHAALAVISVFHSRDGVGTVERTAGVRKSGRFCELLAQAR
jgi:hypothetical protein